MKLEKLNGWLTLVANIGVIIGLIFLVAELDQSNKQALASTEQDRSNEVDRQSRELALSDYLPDIYAKIDQFGMDGLTFSELFRIRTWEGARINRQVGQVYQYEQGFMSESAYQAMLGVARQRYPFWVQLGIPQRGSNADYFALVKTSILEHGGSLEE